MAVENTDLSSLRINRSAPEKSGKSYGRIIIIVLVTILLAGGGYWMLTDGRAAFMSIEVETAVATMTSESQTNSVLTASGYVVAQRKAAISSKATGRLEQLYVIEGDHVKAGAIIGRIENTDVSAALNRERASLEVARANVETVQAEVDDANTVFQRAKTLWATQTNTKADFDAADARLKRQQANLAATKAAVAVAEAAVRSAEVQVENTIIRAPFDGTVLSKNANVGEVITALGGAAGSRGAVVTLADMSSLEVEADVSESNIQKIIANQPCEITLDAYSNKHFPGYVGKIIPTADRAKATVQVKVRFRERDSTVIPEMGAKVMFMKPETADLSHKQEQSKPKLLLPAMAIVTRGGQSAVFLINGERAEQRTITKGGTFGEFIEITGGVTAGDKVVMNPPENLNNGSKISLKK